MRIRVLHLRVLLDNSLDQLGLYRIQIFPHSHQIRLHRYLHCRIRDILILSNYDFFYIIDSITIRVCFRVWVVYRYYYWSLQNCNIFLNSKQLLPHH